ncbi:hypothetical protein B6N60_03509 [Richelia sinica FACHB-800]|uniref:Uncharacterized protein n=1 Tax=Richelia sinica FACHB-800 TaxID=1357546 RepID=A0A975TAA5_9NOST|nr:hypothetical protein [Richelia sinica]MBD2665625.1 hypothetical protein [Richelia sinica FACHB-800]QXE24800.1 hypothetical protein B6N60_03509 [Richelia sinica FACHB-800]
MTTQAEIINQLKILEALSQQGGYSDILALSLRKIIHQERENIQQQIRELETDLQIFEQQYQLSSADFYQRFKTGQLGDEADFVEWSAFYQMWSNLQARLTLLQS